jgi:hypothetical protein
MNYHLGRARNTRSDARSADAVWVVGQKGGRHDL